MLVMGRGINVHKAEGVRSAPDHVQEFGNGSRSRWPQEGLGKKSSEDPHCFLLLFSMYKSSVQNMLPAVLHCVHEDLLTLHAHHL